MSPKIEYIKDENTDRAFPNAFTIEDAMFKVNGNYVCVEPCGGGGHLFGDQYIYISSTGSDGSIVGAVDSPFLTIFRAMEYVMSIDVIGGDIFVVFLDEGPFYINETVLINHQNKIHWVGYDYQTIENSIIITDAATISVGESIEEPIEEEEEW